MTNLIKDKITLPAWNLIKDDTKIKLIYLFPGLLSVMFFSMLLVYQAVYTYVEIFEKTDEIFVVLLRFFESGYLVESIVLGVIFLIIYFFSIPFFEGGLIKYIYNKDSGSQLESNQFFSLGFYHFLPLFKFNNLFSEFKFMSLINAYLFMIRFLGIEYISFLNYLFGSLLVLSILINSLFAYAKFELILEKKDIFHALGESSKIAILNFRTTFRLYFLMFFLNIRVIINFLIFLSFPIIIITTIGVVTSQFFLAIAIIILGFVFICCLLFLGYLTAVLDVFKTSLWFYAYKTGKENMELLKQTDPQ